MSLNTSNVDLKCPENNEKITRGRGILIHTLLINCAVNKGRVRYFNTATTAMDGKTPLLYDHIIFTLRLK